VPAHSWAYVEVTEFVAFAIFVSFAVGRLFKGLK